MDSNKQDSFNTKRSTNIDGFFGRSPAQRPRQPVFHASIPPNHQPVAPQLTDMPRRTDPQPVLSDARAIGASAPGNIGGEPQPRRRHRRGEVAEPEKKKRRSFKQRLKRAGMALGILVILGGTWFGFKFYRDIAKLTGD